MIVVGTAIGLLICWAVAVWRRIRRQRRVYRTSTGRVLTDADIEALADEAELGYDVEEIRRKRGPRPT